MAVGDAGVDDGVLARRRGVELGAHRVERLGDLLRVDERDPLNKRCSMKCDTPARSGRSSRDPAPIQNPSATERTLGTFSEITRSPESSSERTYFCMRSSSLCDEFEAGAGALRLVRASSASRKRVCASRACSGHDAMPKLARGDATLAAMRLITLRASASPASARRCELVAADPERLVTLPQCRLQDTREDLEGHVAARMTEVVVQLLEAVEVADHERRTRCRSGSRARPLLEPVDERAPVEQPGERIVVGEEAQLRKCAPRRSLRAAWFAKMRSACSVSREGIRRSRARPPR